MSTESIAIADLLVLAAEVLELESVDPEQAWYALGGDSLTALQFSILIEETWGAVVDVADIVAAPGLASLHKHLG